MGSQGKIRMEPRRTDERRTDGRPVENVGRRTGYETWFTKENEDCEPVLSFSLSPLCSLPPLSLPLVRLDVMSRRFDSLTSQYGFERANQHSRSCSPVTHMPGEPRSWRTHIDVGGSKEWWGAKGASAKMQTVHRQLYSECGSCLIWLYRTRCFPLSFSVSVCP